MTKITDFNDYELLDMAHEQKLERWGNIILIRPDPQIIWQKESTNLWNKANAIYKRSNTGGGAWTILKEVPSSWVVSYHDLKFNLKLMGFKHTGLFPETAYNWNLIRAKIKEAKRPVKVLNLFAYTGASTIASLKEGAEVVHVDSSKGMVEWAKENVKLNNLENASVHFIVDDVRKFVQREIRRGHKYDIILMDPPTFGRGSKKEVWSIDKDLESLLIDCISLLSSNPLLFIINSYSTYSSTIMENLLNLYLTPQFKGQVKSTELLIPMTNSNLSLPCGTSTTWTNN